MLHWRLGKGSAFGNRGTPLLGLKQIQSSSVPPHPQPHLRLPPSPTLKNRWKNQRIPPSHQNWAGKSPPTSQSNGEENPLPQRERRRKEKGFICRSIGAPGHRSPSRGEPAPCSLSARGTTFPGSLCPWNKESCSPTDSQQLCAGWRIQISGNTFSRASRDF